MTGLMAGLIGVPKVLEHLRAVVAEKGADYVYWGPCVYAIDGAPACIVGHVYARLGLLDEDTQWSGAGVNLLHRDAIARSARSVLRAAQVVQDGDVSRSERGTWGEALAAAEAEATRVGAS